VPEISDDDLGLLACCASRYGARLPYGLVPERIWSLLTPEWQRRVQDALDEEHG
jgi:hypothetical protein